MPFEPQEYILDAGAVAVRVFSNGRKVNEFNTGFGSRTRFAFFGDPFVPVLYAAQSEEVAVCETILHEKLPGQGSIRYEDISRRVSAQVTMARDLRLASLMGDGLRVLGTEAKHVTATMSSQYPRTVRWAEAAHTAGFDGVAWMSNRRNTDRAYMLFGDRVSSADLQPVPLSGRIYAAGDGFNWISDYLGSVGIEIEIS
ncbi:RES family NAD+ phosphorylase [Pseudarthrobacter sp. PH31-O2]|uniref:RES family NAD+ phosphorylase n=1 Tax=Pseudarthrobacter sp. PH31-O2 TaxID=3046206 RepID=UPI0024BBAB45|nr:RES family NAD+ phosphorylase [Pseudarthrobacter sp. PH31-O2]MDJ0354427.1 RES family NAD+ phosphorylase [Pseudarthrobacter sp. PH31-O2]